MKLFKIFAILFATTLIFSRASGQANAFINILTQNSGQVAVGATVFVQVDIGNTGPTSPIGVNKVRAQISVPSAIVTVLPNAQQTGLPPGWIITSNTGSAITVCNGTDPIAVGTQRTVLIAIQGVAVGGPSTIAGVLSFGPGTGVCTGPGSLAGDNTADNTSTTAVTVIPAPSCSLTGVTASAGTIACNGGTTTITATPSGTSTGIEYSLNNGPYQSSNTFTVSAGTYTITARQAATPACTATAPAVSVTEPGVVAAPTTGNIVHPTCTVATGSVELTGLPAGSWTINPGNITGNTSTTTISNLAPGTYNYTVTNAAGCTSGASANITIDPQPATPATPTVGNIVQPTCSVSTGSVELSNLPSGNWTINPGNLAGNTSTITINTLAPGTYNFTVTNPAGCVSTATSNVVINAVLGAPTAPLVNVVQPTCTVATGIITVTSPVTDLTFSLDGGAYTTYPAGGYIVAPGTHTLTEQNVSSCISPVTTIVVDAQPATPAAPLLAVVQPTCAVATGTITVTSSTTGLTFSLDGGAYTTYPAGGYTVATGAHTLTVQNSSGCTSTIANATVNAQPTPPTASVAAGAIACSGGTTTLTVTASGGIGALEYSLDGISYQSANTFTVSAGTHTVTIRDAILCTTTATTTVTQPAAITASAAAGTVNCNGGTTTLTVTATGGSGTLEYSLNNGPYQTINTFTVGAGTYTVRVRAVANPACVVTTAAVTVNQPVGLTVTATAPRITQCGGTTTVTVTGSGGTGPYTGTGTFVKGPGTWSFPVTDSRGCTGTAQITIEAPGCMELKIFPNPANTTSITVNHSTAASGSSMRIYAASGALVHTQAVQQDSYLTTIDVSKLPVGSYVLVYWNGNERKQALFAVASR